MKIKDKIYKLGFMALDELLLHRNTSKKIEVSIEDARILSDLILHPSPHSVIAFDEKEIQEFYKLWAQNENR
jgi:hypothetical protein